MPHQFEAKNRAQLGFDCSKGVPDIMDRITGVSLSHLLQICEFMDGTNHVARIARLADCDIGLTRQAVAHLL
jgi:hypothetical protein